MKHMIRRIKAWIFSRIRPFFVKDINSNEDFVCGICGEPVLKRILYCSNRCNQIADGKLPKFSRALIDIQFDKTKGNSWLMKTLGSAFFRAGVRLWSGHVKILNGKEVHEPVEKAE